MTLQQHHKHRWSEPSQYTLCQSIYGISKHWKDSCALYTSKHIFGQFYYMIINFFHIKYCNSSDQVSFVEQNQVGQLRSNREFGRYILKSSIDKIASLCYLPEYHQTKYSQSAFGSLCQLTRIVFEKCIKTLADMCEKFDIISAQLSVECFYQCLVTANQLYKRKFSKFLHAISMFIVLNLFFFILYLFLNLCLQCFNPPNRRKKMYSKFVKLYMDF